MLKWSIYLVVVVLVLLGCQDKIVVNNLYTTDEGIARTPEHQGVEVEFNFDQGTATCYNNNDSWGVTVDVRTTGADYRIIANWDFLTPRQIRTKKCIFKSGEEVLVTVRKYHLPEGNAWDNWKSWLDLESWHDESSITYVLHDSSGS